MDHSSDIRNATFIGFVAPVLWAIFPVLAVYAEPMPPFQLILIVKGIGFFIFALVWLFKKQTPAKSLKNVTAKMWITGVAGILGFNSFYISSLQLAPPAEAFLITFTWPVIMMLLSSVVLKEPLKIKHIIAALVCFSGVFLIAYARGLEGLKPEYILGYSFAFLAAIIWSFYSIITRKWVHLPSNFLGWIILSCTIGAAILHINFEDTVKIQQNHIIPLIAMGVGPISLAYICWNYAVKHGDIKILSIFALTSPLISTALFISLGLTKATPEIIMAACLIVLGALIGTVRRFRKNLS